jgi:hypothetical protein
VADEPADRYDGTHVSIHFNDCALHATYDCISSDRAQLLEMQLDEAWDIFVAYGFNAPLAGGDGRLPVWVFAPLEDDALGWSRGTHIEIDPQHTQATAASRHWGTPHHELFHQVQRTYDHSESRWVKEGTAKLMEDMVLADLDGKADSGYVSDVDWLVDFLRRRKEPYGFKQAALGHSRRATERRRLKPAELNRSRPQALGGRPGLAVLRRTARPVADVVGEYQIPSLMLALD